MADAILSVELTAKIDGFRDAFNKAIRETENLSKNTKSKVSDIDKSFAQLANDVERAMSKSVSSTASASNNISKNLAKVAASSQNVGGAVAKGSNQAAFALTNLGRVAQDAPFGFMGIQNNLNPLLESFQRLKAETGSSGSALSALGKSLIGPAGLGIALSVVSSAVLFYQQYQQKAKKETVEFTGATETLNKALEGTEYKNAITNVNELKINIGLAKQGLISKEGVLKQYNETIGKTTGRVSNLDQAEKQLAKNADNFIRVTLLKAAAQVALESAAKSAYEAEISRRKKLEDFGNSFLDANVSGARSEEQYKSQQANIINNRKLRQKEEVKISQDAANEQLNIAKKFQDEAAKISAKSGFNFFGDTKVDKPTKAIKEIAKVANSNILAPLIDSAIKLGNLPIFNGEAKINFDLKPLNAAFNQALANAIAFDAQLTDLISSSIGSTLGDIGTQIGMIFNGEGGSIGDAIISGMAAFLNTFGDQLIKFGLASEAFSVLQASVFSGGIVTIGAAIAVIAAGVALKALASGVGKKSGGKGKQSKGQDYTAFANGGIISGPTLGLIGEYAGAKSDPEVVAPLSKLKGLLGLDDVRSNPMNSISNIMGGSSSKAGNISSMNVIKNMMGQTDGNGNVIQKSTEAPILFEHRVEIDGNKLVVLTDRVRATRSRIK